MRSNSKKLGTFLQKMENVTVLKNNTEVVVRVGTIKDKDLWFDFHSHVSDETRRSRYNCTISVEKLVQDECTSMSFEKSIPLVALVKGKIVGIAHLSIDYKTSSSDISLIVSDEWQKSGLGSLLMESSIDVLSKENIEYAIGETERFNTAMINLFKKFNFTLEFDEGWIASLKI